MGTDVGLIVTCATARRLQTAFSGGTPRCRMGKLLHLAHAPSEKVSIENLVGDARVLVKMMV